MKIELPNGETIETSALLVPELVQLANKNPKTPAAQAIYKAIEAGDHKNDESKNEYDDDEIEGMLGSVSFDDLVGPTTIEDTEPETPESIASQLLSRSEIIKMHDSVPPDVGGFLYDSLSMKLAQASKKSSLAEKVGTLVWAIVRGHMFNDANKRTGEMVARAIVKKHGKNIKGDIQELLRKAADVQSGLQEDGFIQGLGLQIA